MAHRNGRVKRLFVAVDIDDETRAQVAAIAADAAALAPARMTWVRADRLHLTLEFFGEADPAAERQILSAFADPFLLAPFDLAFDGIGFFPPRGSPRVLWLGIATGLAELRRLRDMLERRLALRAAPHEAFHPHLTLARFRERAARPDPAKLAKIRASAGPCRIDRVTLYESHLSPQGPTYSVLAQAALNR
jgi:2'-5' RNA ligase